MTTTAVLIVKVSEQRHAVYGDLIAAAYTIRDAATGEVLDGITVTVVRTVPVYTVDSTGETFGSRVDAVEAIAPGATRDLAPVGTFGAIR